MCTAVSYSSSQGHFFGRNLDLEFTYQEQVAVTPRNYPFSFRSGFTLAHHYAMIGMATVSGGYPLYYEATNERGLSMAGLNFPGNAAYLPKACGKDNLAPYELIPWILGQCASVREAKVLLEKLNVWKLPFSREFPLSPLHWMISDREESIVMEAMADGVHLYENPIGVLTNNPPFPYHLYHLADYRNLTRTPGEDRFGGGKLKPYSNGMGAIGLPGDFSSGSRFVRAAFVKENSEESGNPVSQFFHILASVAMPCGSVQMRENEYEITQYSSCCDTHNGIYYYTTYDNSRITAVDMRKCPLLADDVMVYPLRKSADIRFEN